MNLIFDLFGTVIEDADPESAALRPGALAALERLHEAGHALYAVSDRPYIPTYRAMDRLGLPMLVTDVICPHRTQEGWTRADGVRLLLKRLGEAVYVCDARTVAESEIK